MYFFYLSTQEQEQTATGMRKAWERLSLPAFIRKRIYQSLYLQYKVLKVMRQYISTYPELAQQCTLRWSQETIADSVLMINHTTRSSKAFTFVLHLESTEFFPADVDPIIIPTGILLFCYEMGGHVTMPQGFQLTKRKACLYEYQMVDLQIKGSGVQKSSTS